VPRLFSAIKTAVDRDRAAGRFILTGSANVLLVPALSDSLAGRMEIIRLHPLAQAEIESHETSFLEQLFGDSGLAATLLDAGSDTLLEDRKLFGQLLETFVFQELNRAAGWRDDAPRFFHFRDRDGIEIDIVIELGARAVAGVEVKAGATVIESDFSGLRKLQLAAGKRFRRGVVLYDGEAVMPFGERLQAVPIRLLWEAA
jgi:predicted AAA+ superfamily ATPase